MLWNSTISTPGARYATGDIGNMHLMTPMDRYEYMLMKANLVPEEFITLYNLECKIDKGYLYMEIRSRCYGLPQAVFWQTNSSMNDWQNTDILNSPIPLIETAQLRLLIYIFANQHLQAPTSSLVPQSLIMYLNMFQA